MTVIHYPSGPQYLNSDHVTCYVITCTSAFDWVYTEQWYLVRNYYVRRDVDRVSESQIKVPELESKLVVHSSNIVPE